MRHNRLHNCIVRWMREKNYYLQASRCGITLLYQHSNLPLTYLVDDIDAVVNPLPSENRVEVVKPVLQVVFPVTKWDDDSHLNNKDSFG